MGFANKMVARLLQSPMHRLLSGSTALVRYTGRRSGRVVTTPVQYASHGDDVVILVGHPQTKTWWRNFSSERGLEVLVRGEWVPMTGRAYQGADDAEVVAGLLAAYLQRFPRAVKALEGDTDEQRARSAVVVRGRTR